MSFITEVHQPSSTSIGNTQTIYPLILAIGGNNYPYSQILNHLHRYSPLEHKIQRFKNSKTIGKN